MIPKKILFAYDFVRNEIRNAVIQLRGTPPDTPVEGQVYTDSTTHLLKYHNGTMFVSDTERARHSGTQPASTISDFNTAADARVAAAVGVSVQALDADLSALAALPATAGVLSRTGAGTFAARTLSSETPALTWSDPTGVAGDPTASIANVVAAGNSGLLTGTDKTKLDGIAVGATANSPDATLLARANHTGTQLASTVSNFDAQVRTSRLDQMATPTASVLMGDQKIIGGTGTTSDLTLQTTSGVGTTGADFHLLVGNNGGAEALTVLNNGNVGIGATSPAVKLQVGNGTAQVTTMTRGGGTNSAPVLSLFNVGNREGFIAQVIDNLYIGNTSGLANYNDATLASGAQIAISTTGNVGIGTTNPASKLEIANTTTLKGLQVVNSASATGTSAINAYSNVIHTGTAGNALLAATIDNAASTGTALYVQNDGTGYGAIITNGNVGIGTASPGSLLSVSGSGAAIGDFNSSAGSGGYVSFSQAGTVRGYIGTGNSLTVGATVNDLSIRPQTGALLFSTGGGSEVMRLTQAGSVGIGTTAPGCMLDVQSSTLNTNLRLWPTSDSISPNVIMRRSRSAGAYPLINDLLGDVYFHSHGGQVASRISVKATENHSGSAVGSSMEFYTALNGAATAASRMTIANTGLVGIGTSTPTQRLDVSGSLILGATGDGYLKIRDFDGGGATATDLINRDGNLTLFTGGLVVGDYANNVVGALGGGTAVFQTKVGIGTIAPTAVLHLKAGTATASTAPLKFTSGTLLTTPEVGAVEFLTDDLCATITTGVARKTIAWQPEQVNQTASRALNTTYTNTGTRAKQIMATVRCAISAAGGNAYVQGKSDASAPPTTAASGLVGIQAGLLGEDNTFQVTFVVAPGMKYRIDSATTNGTAVLGDWFEVTY